MQCQCYVLVGNELLEPLHQSHSGKLQQVKDNVPDDTSEDSVPFGSFRVVTWTYIRWKHEKYWLQTVSILTVDRLKVQTVCAAKVPWFSGCTDLPQRYPGLQHVFSRCTLITYRAILFPRVESWSKCRWTLCLAAELSRAPTLSWPPQTPQRYQLSSSHQLDLFQGHLPHGPTIQRNHQQLCQLLE